MMDFIRKYNMPLLARFILGFVFIYASLDKIADPIAFSDNIDNYHISPVQLNNLAALFIPWLELVIGLCLITGVFLDGAAIISMLLMAFFIFIITQAYARGISLHCGCFKGAADPGMIDLRQDMLKRIFEDILFLGLSVLIYFRHTFRGTKKVK